MKSPQEKCNEGRVTRRYGNWEGDDETESIRVVGGGRNGKNVKY